MKVQFFDRKMLLVRTSDQSIEQAVGDTVILQYLIITFILTIIHAILYSRSTMTNVYYLHMTEFTIPHKCETTVAQSIHKKYYATLDIHILKIKKQKGMREFNPLKDRSYSSQYGA
jgi:hypothetical protein